MRGHAFRKLRGLPPRVAVHARPSLRPATARALDQLAAAALFYVERGTCRSCGCTHDRACPGGCYWVVLPQGKKRLGLCSNCQEAA